MGHGLVEDVIKWRRHGLADPWLPDSFMAELSPEAVGRLERYGSLLDDVDQVDWTDPGAPIAVVLMGEVRVCHVRSDGQQALVRVADHGDLLNGESLFTTAPSSLRFQASPGTSVLAVPRKKFRAAFDHPEIQRALLRTLAQRLQESDFHRTHSGRKVEHRLWAFLVSLARRHGRRRGPDVVLDLGLTQAHLAAAVGASHHSVEAALQRLRAAGKVSTRYASCVLHELPDDDELDRSG